MEIYKKTNNNDEFNILGHNIKYRPDIHDGDDFRPVEAKTVVNLLIEELNVLKNHNPSLGNDQIAILAALKIANDYQYLRNYLGEALNKFEHSAIDTLKYLDEVSPSP